MTSVKFVNYTCPVGFINVDTKDLRLGILSDWYGTELFKFFKITKTRNFFLYLSPQITLFYRNSEMFQPSYKILIQVPLANFNDPLIPNLMMFTDA